MTDNQLKGNWAEQYISARLAEKGCLVRHVPQGHDIGIDLYCETIEEHTPFLHFWCQIKTSKKWNGKEKRISFSSNKSEIEYWLKQPVPVFVFLVPDLRDEYKTFIPFYICRTDLIQDKKKIYSWKKIESPSDLSDFLSKELPLLYFLWELRKGKVSSLKTVKPEYTRFFLPFITQYFENNLLISLRDTLGRLSHDIMFPNKESYLNFRSSVLDHTEEERASRAEPYVKAYNIITMVQNYSSGHYEVPCIMGFFSELKTENKKALSFYEKSLSIIERDKIIDTSKGYWKNTKNEIQEHIKRTKRKLRKTS